MGNKLVVQNLSKHFGSVKAVTNVSFQVDTGEVVGLLGPNGAGKTTAMRMITGFLAADAGEVLIDNENVELEPIHIRNKIGYLPENCPLYLDLEVIESLAYFAKLRGIPKNEISACVKEMVSVCGLKEVVGRTIGHFSKGFRQRVGLAQALIHKPEILILDEPTSGLDPNQIIEIRNLIKELGKTTTIILSTHILQEVEAVCSRALIINRGEIVGAGTLDELQQTQSGAATYKMRIKGDESEIRTKLSEIPDLSFANCKSNGGVGWLDIQLSSQTRDDQSEKLFHWVVKNGWSLKMLQKEDASLEEVFRSLTK